MYLGTYTFKGDTDELVAAYDRMKASIPVEQMLHHLCVRTDDGLLVVDTCPTHADFRSFSTDPLVRQSLTAAGLPEPQVTEIGEVHFAHAPEPAIS
jgi:hypothetical protein